MEKRNIRLTISYDGTTYHGFQVQPNQPSIQAELERAVSKVAGVTTQVIGSGRTDAGVHARGQVVNFFTTSKLPADRWCRAINTYLPDSIVVWEAEDVPETFHARKSAKGKTYCYTINGNRYADPLMRHVELQHPGPLNFEAMEQAIQYLEGEHDFTSFCSVHAASESRVRNVYEARMLREPVTGMERSPGNGRIRLFFTGNGFLYNMVRIMAGTILHVGEGKIAPTELPRILEARDRSAAGPTAKACGLTLWQVYYSESFSDMILAKRQDML